MPAPVAGVHVFGATKSKSWMAGTSPAMTARYLIACGLIGEPVPPVMTSGAPLKKNS
jgi:hypothetical protein